MKYKKAHLAETPSHSLDLVRSKYISKYVYNTVRIFLALGDSEGRTRVSYFFVGGGEGGWVGIT
jgi:hypothetical protein